MNEVLGIYLKELRNDNSNKDESLELIRKARSGDKSSRDKLVKNYLLLVVKIAREYANKGVPLEDLISEGNVGLLSAFDKFDESKGAPFSTCARFWIKAAIIRNCMHKQGVVRLPENVSELMRTDRWTGVKIKEISIDTPNQEGNSMADSIADEFKDTFSTEEEVLLKKKIERILSFLTARDAQIVKSCYGIDCDEALDVEEAAEHFKLSTTRINQILKNSLKVMRISHDSLPDSQTKTVDIISAKYGADDDTVDVTEAVVELYINKEIIKSNNRLGGDPCFGTVKYLLVEYIYNGRMLTKKVPEGGVLKF